VLLAIVGAGAQGKVTLETWRAQHPGATFVLVDDAPALLGSELLGVPVAGDIDHLLGLDAEVVIALGNNPTRLAVAGRLDGRVRWGRVVHPSAVVAPSATLGPGTVVLPGAVVHTDARVGAHVIVNTGVIIEHDCVIEDAASLSPGTRMGGRVRVGAGAFVSTGVTLAPRVTVGVGAVIGAGAVVVHDIPERVLALGVPARPVRPIDASFDWKRLL